MDASPIQFRRAPTLALFALVGLSMTACLAPVTSAPQTGPAVVFEAAPAAVGHARDSDARLTEVLWKERMGQGYVYVEHRGDYRECSDALAGLVEATRTHLGTPVVGAPFLLLFDDPGSVPLEQLRARVCLPVDAPPAELGAGIHFAVLPSAMVVYASVPARASEAMRSVPDLFRSMESLGGTPAGPIREVLHGTCTEVQLPWTRAGG